MPTKKPAKKPAKSRKIQVSLPENLVKALDREVRRARLSGSETSRGALVRELVALGVVRRTIAESSDAALKAEACEGLLREAEPLARSAAANYSVGGREVASRLYLAAASREIEAISYMSPDDEAGVKSALIMVVHHVKRGTGYKHLPDVVVASPPSDSVQ